MNYIEIDSIAKDGFKDLVFTIDKVWTEDSKTRVLNVRGNYQGSLVGFQVRFKPDMKPGMIEGGFDRSAIYSDGITLCSTGNESDAFVKALADFFEVKYKNETMIERVGFTSCALEGDPKHFETEELRFKVFHDDQNLLSLYCEMFIRVNVSQGRFELNEKNVEFRKNIYGAFTGQKKNFFEKLMKKY